MANAAGVMATRNACGGAVAATVLKPGDSQRSSWRGRVLHTLRVRARHALETAAPRISAKHVFLSYGDSVARAKHYEQQAFNRVNI